MQQELPVLSVVLITGPQRHTSEQALKSLLEQTIIDQIEILLMDCVSDEVPPLPGSDHPRVICTRLPENAIFEVVLTNGIRAAHAPIIASLEEHAFALPRWAEAMLEAHQGPWAGVCGEVLNGNAGYHASDAEFFTTRDIRWQSPSVRREVQMIDGANASFKRDILLQYGDSLIEMFSAEALLMLQLAKDGYKLLLEPEAQYYHVNEAEPESLILTYFFWHRSFGYARAKLFNWSLPQRVFRVAIAPLLPWWHSAKTLGYILTSRREQLGKFALNLPLIVVYHYCAAAGQVAGLLFGQGNASERFSERERGVKRVIRI